MNPGILYNDSKSYEPAVLLEQSSSASQVPNENSILNRFLGNKTLAEIERRAIIATIKACKGNKAASARSLGISEKSIYNKMKRLKITNADLFGTEVSEPATTRPNMPQGPNQHSPSHWPSH